MTFELPDKRYLVGKIVANVDKTVLGTTTKNQQNSVINAWKNVPPFFLTFEIFDRNVHNWMVKEVKPFDIKIIQLDRTNVKVIGELKSVLIRLSSNPKVHQIIDIIVVDIP